MTSLNSSQTDVFAKESSDKDRRGVSDGYILKNVFHMIEESKG